MVLREFAHLRPPFLKGTFTLFLLGLVFYPFLPVVCEALKFLKEDSIVKAQLEDKLLKSLSFALSLSALSTFLSLLLASLNLLLLKRSFKPFQKLALGILFLPSGIATIVSTLSLLVFFGNQGILKEFLALGGLENLWDSRWLYSYAMIAFLNVLYNLPLATLILWGVEQYFPFHLLYKSKILGASPWQRFYSVLLPLLRPHLLAGFCLIFVYCFISFFPILFLGNKQGYLTPEVLIYEEISWLFSLPSASWVALLQMILLWILLSVFLLQKPVYTPFHKDRLELEPYTRTWKATIGSFILSGLSSLLWAPLIFKAISLPLPRLKQSFIDSLGAIGNSLLIGSSSGLFTFILTTWLLFAYPKFFSKKRAYWLLFLPFTLSPLLNSLFYQNLFSAWFRDPSPYWGLIVSQTTSGLPLALYLLSRDLAGFETLPTRAKVLGARGLSRWLSLDLPLFRLTYLRVFFLSLIASLGNLSTGLLYLPSNFQTIPLRINRLLGFYRLEEATVVASLFVLLFFVLLGAFLWIDHLLKRLK